MSEKAILKNFLKRHRFRCFPRISRVYLHLGKTDTLSEMRQQKVRTVRYSLETALHRAPQLCSFVLTDLKLLPNVHLFKSKIEYVLNVLANSVRPT